MSYKLTKQKYLNETEYSNLETHMRDLLPYDPRNATLVLLALYTGARASEVLNMRFQDFDHDAKTVHIKGLKNSDDRDIPLPRWLFREVVNLEKMEVDPKKPFPITYPRLQQIWRQFGVSKKPFHALRHTFAYRLYQRSKDVYLVKTALGHRDIKNTMIYVNFEYTQTQLRKLVVEE